MLIIVFVIISSSNIQEADGRNLCVINQRTHKLFLHCWHIVAGRSQADNRRMGNGTGYRNSMGVPELVITQPSFTHNIIQVIDLYYLVSNYYVKI